MPWTGARARALVSFAATVVVAWVWRWEARDLMWGAYVSSLTFGYAYGVVLIVANPGEVDAGRGLRQPGRLLAVLAFFSAHFLLFHLFQGIVLNGLFPVSASPLAFLPAAAAGYWPVVVATFVARAGELGSALRPSDDTARLLRPYGTIARMQAVLFVLLLMAGVGLTRFAVYPLLVFYFFPFPATGRAFRRWFDRLEARMNDPGSGGT